LVKRTFDRTVALLAEELRRACVTDVQTDDPLEGKPWPALLEGSRRHMGTTRMHDSPGHGVVDCNCRVHGMSNHYVAGRSVSPAVGANFPTVSIAAITLHLSEHILKALQGEVASLGWPASMATGEGRRGYEEVMPFATPTHHARSETTFIDKM